MIDAEFVEMDISFISLILVKLGTLLYVRYVGSGNPSFLVMEITMTRGVVEKNKRLTGKNQERHPDVENHPDVGNRPDVEDIKKIE